jgi:hypothetical protein
MNQALSPSSLEGISAYVGIDWADQKNDVVLRSAAEPNKVEYKVIAHKPEALMDWVSQIHQRFGAKGKVVVCLEQSRGGLIYHLMGYEFFELYPINPRQLASFRETFAPSGAKDDRPDADLLCELVSSHRDRLRQAQSSRPTQRTVQ